MHRALKYVTPERRVEGLTRDQVCVRFRGKVLLLARRIHERLSPEASIDVDDLASCGAIGLLEAFDRFDGARGIQFSTFAEYRIRGAIYDALRDEDTFTRRRRQLAKRIERAIVEATGPDGQQPPPEEIAEKLGIPLEKYWAALDRVKPISHTSIDAVSDDGDGEGRPLIEKLMDPSIPAPEARIAAQQLRDSLREAILELPERQRQAVMLYYGKELSLAEIGAVFGVTVSRMSQILSEARLKLRKRLAQVVDDVDAELT